MKTFLLVLLPVLAGAAAFAAEPVRVTAEPMEFPAGGTTRVEIIFTKPPREDGVKLPEVSGARWHTDRTEISQSVSSVNGRTEQTLSCSLPFSAAAPGEVTIPPLEVRFADGTTGRSRPLKLKVLAPGEAPKVVRSAPAGRILLPEGRKSFYVGEAIPVGFELAIPEKLKTGRAGYPQPACDGAPRFSLPAGRGSGHPYFGAAVEGGRETPEGYLRTRTTHTVMRFAAPGEFSLSATEQLEIFSPRRRRGGFFDDDFFNIASARVETIVFPAVKLRIVPPPPAPSGSLPLAVGAGLRVEAALSAATARAGEPVELDVKLVGEAGNSAELTLPRLDFPAFRVYPPEVKTAADGTRSIRCALVPLAAGEHEFQVSFAVFDPARGEWRTFPEKFKLAVTGSAAVPPTALPPGEKTPARREFAPPPAPAETPSLAKRGALRGGGAFGVLALVALLIELVRRLERRRTPEEEARRREVAELIRRVKAGDRVNPILRDGGAAALARALGLPEDTSLTELARRVDDPELREVLASLERNEFAPEVAREDRAVSPEARRKLVKLLKRSLLLLAAAVAFAAPGAEKIAPENDLPRTLLALERAHRYAPRDAKIRSALAAVENELGVPPRAESRRDRVRPDEYLTLAGIFLGLALVAVAALRKKRKSAAFVVALTLAVLGAGAAALAWSQHTGGAPYDPARAVAVARETELSSLPAARGGHVVGILNGGSFVVVVDERGDYLRVKGENAEGWCPKTAVEKVFPGE